MIIPNFDKILRERTVQLHYPEFYQMLQDKYLNLSFPEQLYWYVNKLESRPTCKCCGGEVAFINSKEGYRLYCSRKCLNSDPEKKEHTKQTNIERYGGVAPACSESVKNKSRETNIERYGVDNVMKLREKSLESQQTRVERYGGCGNASCSIREKYLETVRERYGVDNPMLNEDIREKRDQTNLERFSSTSPFTSKQVQEKAIKTCIERYGVDHYNNSDKTKQTMKDRYGYETNFQNPNTVIKGRETKENRYGDPNYNNHEKYVETCTERYGLPSYMNTEEFKSSLHDKYQVTSPTQIPGVLQKIYDTKKKNHTFNISTVEVLFKEYLDSRNIRYEYQYKSDEYPFSCDFYLPELDLYIEIQGHWGHGPHPYTGSEEDKEIVEYWKSKHTKYYDNAIQTWTIRDVKKRELAKANNLNYLEIFSCEIQQVIDIFEDYIQPKI